MASYALTTLHNLVDILRVPLPKNKHSKIVWIIVTVRGYSANAEIHNKMIFDLFMTSLKTSHGSTTFDVNEYPY